MKGAGGVAQLQDSRDRFGWLLRRGNELDVADGVLPAAQRSACARPHDAGRFAEPGQNGLGEHHRAAQRNPRDGMAELGQGGGYGLFNAFVERGDIANRVVGDGRAEIRGGCGPERLMKGGELFDADGARFEEPAQIGRQIRYSRLEQDPRGRLIHVPQPLKDVRIRIGRGALEEFPEVGVGGDAMGAHERRGAPEH
jgi:hypothetical protein